MELKGRTNGKKWNTARASSHTNRDKDKYTQTIDGLRCTRAERQWHQAAAAAALQTQSYTESNFFSSSSFKVCMNIEWATTINEQSTHTHDDSNNSSSENSYKKYRIVLLQRVCAKL